MEGSELQGVLVCLCARVDKEEIVVLIAASLAETLSQFHLKHVLYGIAVEAQFVELLCHLLHVVWMAMTYADYCVSAVEVEVLLTFVVPRSTAFTLDDVDVEERIYVE